MMRLKELTYFILCFFDNLLRFIGKHEFTLYKNYKTLDDRKRNAALWHMFKELIYMI